MAREPVGLLIIRAWAQNGSAEPLRAQLRMTTDTALGFEREALIADPAAIEALVRQWLNEILEAAG